MSPSDLKYSKTHEWVRVYGDTATVGITAHAQDTLGDITFVELPKVGIAIGQGGEAGVIESVKAASDLLSPVSGEVASVNNALLPAPETINSDPYGAGWLFTVKIADKAELDTLMDAAAYEKFLETEA
ncbi:MAG: glycine cleavage system protein GcvH [Chitinispirillia bacterium]|nr:glycine cleavage system protein GcvH [Chitinispirillia bacterium]MCL2241116.1 glycine cleavage system protein GcvH [Chitinispirillia bacterium]